MDCCNSMAPSARQAGHTYFLGDISHTPFIWRVEDVCSFFFLRELDLLSGAEEVAAT